MDNEITFETYKNHLKDFYGYLQKDHQRWLVYQIKSAMLKGHNRFRIAPLFKKQWKRYKNILNFWKPIPKEHEKYYHKQTNVLILDPLLRKMIDLATTLEITWFPASSGNRDTFYENFDSIQAFIDYSKFR